MMALREKITKVVLHLSVVVVFFLSIKSETNTKNISTAFTAPSNILPINRSQLPSILATKKQLEDCWGVINSINNQNNQYKENGKNGKNGTTIGNTENLIQQNTPNSLIFKNNQDKGYISYTHPHKKGIFLRGTKKGTTQTESLKNRGLQNQDEDDKDDTKYGYTSNYQASEIHNHSSPHENIEENKSIESKDSIDSDQTYHFALNEASRQKLIEAAKRLPKTASPNTAKRILGPPSKETFSYFNQQNQQKLQKLLIYCLKQYKPGVYTQGKDEHLILSFNELNSLESMSL